MSTELSIYQKVVDPLAFMREAGVIIARSRMFGCETEEQGQALSLISMTEGLPMLELRRRYHIINGDLTMRAEYMRSEYRRIGGVYKWINIGDDGVEARARWAFKENDMEIAYSIEDAKREGLVKPGSRWVKDAGSMLRARCTTKAIRLIAPEVLAGFYTDEELGTEAPPVQQASDPEVIDGEFEPVKAASEDAPFDAGTKTEAQVEPASGMCSASMSDSINTLFGELGFSPELRTKAIAKRNPEASTLRQLTAAQAEDLRAALLAKQAEVTAAMIKARLGEIEQQLPGISAKAIDKLRSSGFQKFSDLPHEKATELLSAMASPDTLEQFFGVVIWTPVAKN